MKFNWKKIFNPNNINFSDIKNMSNEEFKAYNREIIQSEYARVWIRYAWLFNYLCMTNTWQYILALWISK
jgi:head-tail adaptor